MTGNRQPATFFYVDRRTSEPYAKEKLIGREILYFPEVDSTNRRAHDQARKGAGEGTVGPGRFPIRRGRAGWARPWQSPAGVNLYASIILRPSIPPPSAPQITLLAGVAVARALARVSGLEPASNGPTTSSSTGERWPASFRRWKSKGARIRSSSWEWGST